MIMLVWKTHLWSGLDCWLTKCRRYAELMINIADASDLNYQLGVNPKHALIHFQ